MSSPNPTPWAIRCPKHGEVFLTEDEYKEQVGRGGDEWRCTRQMILRSTVDLHTGIMMNVTQPCAQTCEPIPPPEFDSAAPDEFIYTGPMLGPVVLPSRPERFVPPELGFLFEVPGEGERAHIAADGRLRMTDETGALVESYDWARFGKIAYRAVTNGKEPPTHEKGTDE